MNHPATTKTQLYPCRTLTITKIQVQHNPHLQQSSLCQQRLQRQRQPQLDRQRSERHVGTVSVPGINLPPINCCTTVSMMHRRIRTCKSQNQLRHHSPGTQSIGHPKIVRRTVLAATTTAEISQNAMPDICSHNAADRSTASCICILGVCVLVCGCVLCSAATHLLIFRLYYLQTLFSPHFFHVQKTFPFSKSKKTK